MSNFINLLRSLLKIPKIRKIDADAVRQALGISQSLSAVGPAPPLNTIPPDPTPPDPTPPPLPEPEPTPPEWQQGEKQERLLNGSESTTTKTETVTKETTEKVTPSKITETITEIKTKTISETVTSPREGPQTVTSSAENTDEKIKSLYKDITKYISFVLNKIANDVRYRFIKNNLEAVFLELTKKTNDDIDLTSLINSLQKVLADDDNLRDSSSNDIVNTIIKAIKLINMLIEIKEREKNLAKFGNSSDSTNMYSRYNKLKNLKEISVTTELNSKKNLVIEILDNIKVGIELSKSKFLSEFFKIKEFLIIDKDNVPDIYKIINANQSIHTYSNIHSNQSGKGYNMVRGGSLSSGNSGESESESSQTGIEEVDVIEEAEAAQAAEVVEAAELTKEQLLEKNKKDKKATELLLSELSPDIIKTNVKELSKYSSEFKNFMSLIITYNNDEDFNMGNLYGIEKLLCFFIFLLFIRIYITEQIIKYGNSNFFNDDCNMELYIINAIIDKINNLYFFNFTEIIANFNKKIIISTVNNLTIEFINYVIKKYIDYYKNVNNVYLKYFEGRIYIQNVPIGWDDNIKLNKLIIDLSSRCSKIIKNDDDFTKLKDSPRLLNDFDDLLLLIFKTNMLINIVDTILTINAVNSNYEIIRKNIYTITSFLNDLDNMLISIELRLSNLNNQSAQQDTETLTQNDEKMKEDYTFLLDKYKNEDIISIYDKKLETNKKLQSQREKYINNIFSLSKQLQTLKSNTSLDSTPTLTIGDEIRISDFNSKIRSFEENIYKIDEMIRSNDQDIIRLQSRISDQNSLSNSNYRFITN